MRSRQRAPFSKKSARGLADLFPRVRRVLSSAPLSSRLPRSHPSPNSWPHLPYHFVAAWHTRAPLGHPSPRPTFAVPSCHCWGLAAHPAGGSGAVPSPPNPPKGSGTPPGTSRVWTRRRSLDVVRTQMRVLPPVAVTPTLANFVTGLLAGSLSDGGSLPRQARPAVGAQESGRRIVAGRGGHRARRQATPPPAVPAPAAAAAAAATARIQAGARVSPLLLQHLGPDGKALPKFAASTFPRCAALRGARPPFPRVHLRICRKTPQRRSLLGRCLEAKSSVWDTSYFLAGFGENQGHRVALRTSGSLGKSWAHSMLAVAGLGQEGRWFLMGGGAGWGDTFFCARTPRFCMRSGRWAQPRLFTRVHGYCLHLVLLLGACGNFLEYFFMKRHPHYAFRFTSFLPWCCLVCSVMTGVERLGSRNKTE